MRADEPEVPVKLRAAIKPPSSENVISRIGETALKAKPRVKLVRTSLTNGKFVNPASEGIFGKFGCSCV
jgi:hypothetical protein